MVFLIVHGSTLSAPRKRCGTTADAVWRRIGKVFEARVRVGPARLHDPGEGVRRPDPPPRNSRGSWTTGSARDLDGSPGRPEAGATAGAVTDRRRGVRRVPGTCEIHRACSAQNAWRARYTCWMQEARLTRTRLPIKNPSGWDSCPSRRLHLRGSVEEPREPSPDAPAATREK